MQDKKVWLPHLLIRLSFFPVVFGLIYFVLKLAKPEIIDEGSGLRVAFFGSAALVALTLMAETILLFGKKKIPKSLCNILTIFVIILCVIILAPKVF